MAETTEYLSLDHLDIQALIAHPAVEKGERGNTVLLILNAAGKSGASNHEILALGSELAIRWGISDPGKNLYDHWLRLMRMLRNVRRHYPNGEEG